jgi:hypothetical protein
MASDLTLAGYTVWEALAVSEVLYLCEHQNVDLVVIGPDVEDADVIEVQMRRITLRLTKSVTVGAVGMALAAGKFKLTDKVISFYPDELPAQVSNNLVAMTVEDLLTMKTGHDSETSGSKWRAIKTSWVAEFYKIPVPADSAVRRLASPLRLSPLPQAPLTVIRMVSPGAARKVWALIPKLS